MEEIDVVSRSVYQSSSKAKRFVFESFLQRRITSTVTHVILFSRCVELGIEAGEIKRNRKKYMLGRQTGRWMNLVDLLNNMRCRTY